MESPTLVAELLASGVEHHRAGRFDAALRYYSCALECAPAHGEIWRLLGVVALQTGDSAAARELLERALLLMPDDSAAWGALGGVNEIDGRFAAAFDAYWRACAGEPAGDAVAGLLRMGAKLGRNEEVRAIGEAAAARGDAGGTVLRLVGALRLDARDFAGAIAATLASLACEAHPDAYANLAAAYLHVDRIDDALGACEAALALDPAHAAAAINLGIAHKWRADLQAALAAFRRAVDSGSDDAHPLLGANLLLAGDYRAGWHHYGWTTAERKANPAFAALPMWDGAPAPKKRLLVWPEQGVGDNLMMVRFLARARQLVGNVTLACLPHTQGLLRSVAGVDRWIESADPPDFSAYDLWLPSTRLPVIFECVPTQFLAAPYLRADPARVATFAERLAVPGKLRVGLVWSGNPGFEWNDVRSCELADLEPLADLPDCVWFALQQGDAGRQRPRGAMRLVPINEAVVDFADTAAIIASLDLVITVDTSVANLAGALGAPAWVLLSTRADWRWLAGGETTPWYPSLRLFRQTDAGDWASVIARVDAALREFTAERMSKR